MQAAGRSLDQLAWAERLAGGTWYAEVTIRNVGSFDGTGATRRAAREVAAHAAYIRATQQSESGSQ
ncbi:hypothetical protein EXIGLDRAFT_737169 [Exidia glandulosa HHB12029]|uniref:DRBM domain-containing protein n=1 Tax=Exidia glandulosa HHB12029 TaxID=1314781 RepID=A0A166AQT8_EXIGL|nr:hypothetical protein EXIGLDRAFT_737169 [Exidia glandulosa HHB12029]